EARKDAWIARRRVAPVRARPSPERRLAAAENLHARADYLPALKGPAHIAWGDPFRVAKNQPNPVLSIPDVVDQQPCRSAVVRHHDVGVAVVVDVAERRAAADLENSEDRARSRADVLESRSGRRPEIPQELLPLPQQRRLAGDDGAVDGEEIEAAVVVGVEPRRAESGEAQARR